MNTEKGRKRIGLVVVPLLGVFLLQPLQVVKASEVTSAPAETSASQNSTVVTSSSDVTTGNATSSTAQSADTPNGTAEPSSITEKSATEQASDLTEAQEQTEKPSEDAETKPETTTDNQMAENEAEPPQQPTQIQLPQSTVKQKVPDADIASGALVYSYDFALPAGRGSAGPGLSLNYNSQQVEEGSAFGLGWGLSLAYIERKNINGFNKMFDSHDFTSSLSGDIKLVENGSGGVENYRAKVDAGDGLKYQFTPEWDGNGGKWQVFDKTGNVYTFGVATESRISNPIKPDQVFRWYLTEVRDASGNFMRVNYQKVDEQVYPFELLYTGRSEDMGIYRVEFVLGDRTDQVWNGKYGFLVQGKKRIVALKVYTNSVLTGEYAFGYDYATGNGRSLLKSISFTGYDSAGSNGIADRSVQFEYLENVGTNLLTKIEQSSGGIVTVQYRSANQYFDETTHQSLNPKLPFTVYVVEQITHDDRNGLQWSNHFVYSGAWYYYNGPMDRRFVGFEKVVKTDDVGTQLVTFYHQGNGDNLTFGERDDDWAKAGKVYKTELRDAQGHLMTEKLNQWEFQHFVGVSGGSQSGDTWSVVALKLSVDRDFDGNDSHRDSAVEYQTDLVTGHLLGVTNWGEVEATGTGAFVDIGDDKTITSIEYAHPVFGNFITGLVSRMLVVGQTGEKVSEEKDYYDGLGFGQVALGRETKTEKWIVGESFATTTKSYDDYGQVVVETDANGNATSYQYDQWHLYPVIVSNALGQSTRLEYDLRIGKPHKVTDANGSVQKTTYDGLGRVVTEEMTIPDQPDPEVLFVSKTYAYGLVMSGEQVVGRKTTETVYLDDFTTVNPRSTDTIVYTDGFERPIQQRKRVDASTATPETSRYVVVDTRYNNIAQVEKTSLPYFSDGSEKTSATENPELYTVMSYDAMQRVVSVSNAVGTTTTSYDNWASIMTDALGNQKGLFKDAEDRLVKVEEHNDNHTYTTRYAYNYLGKLVKITDALGNVRQFAYDGLGRNTSAEDLHAVGDDTFGVWTYSYDHVGNVIGKTDPNGHTFSYIYDALNRVLSESVTGDDSAGSSYTYDNCAYGVGRVCRIENTTLATTNQYNILGNLVSESKQIYGASKSSFRQIFLTKYSYDRIGHLVTVENPDRSAVKNDYGLSGQVVKVWQKENGETEFHPVVNKIVYAPSGAVAVMEQANGAVLTNTYDEHKAYRLINKTTLLNSVRSSQVLQRYDYTYDSLNNIVQVVDTSDVSTRKTVQYSYDDLSRLVWARSTGVVAGQDYEQTYEYDAIGNLVYRSDVGQMLYDGDEGESYANPHAVTSVAGVAYSYDRNGNLLADDTKTLTWNAYNQVRSISVVGIVPKVISYGYDTAGMRVVIEQESGRTAYPSQYYNASASLIQKHIFVNDTAVATVSGSGNDASIAMIHTDHLGSTAVVTSETGQVNQVLDYYPFGGVRLNDLSSGPDEQRQYTGHEFDDETGLVYAEARYYNPSTGRFVSQDAVFIGAEFDLSDPQSMNSYAYARNNPIRLVDPDGRWFMDMVKNMAGYGVGMTQVFVGTIFNTIAHPIATIKAVGNTYVGGAKAGYTLGRDLLSNPRSTVAEVSKGMSLSYNHFESKSPYEQGKSVGNLAGSVAGNVVVGAGISYGIKVIVPPGIAEVSPLLETKTRFVSHPDGTIIDVQPTLDRISKGIKDPHYNDGSIYQNREGYLPKKPYGYYRESVIRAPGSSSPGPHRLIQGFWGENYYSNHYTEPPVKVKR